MKRLIQIPTLFIAMLLVVSCGGDDGPTGGDNGDGDNNEPTTGAVEVTAKTTGDDTDADGYTISADGESTSISSNGTAILSALSVGDTDAKLGGLAGNCSVKGKNPQTVSITAGDTTSSSFDVGCQPQLQNEIVYTDGTGNSREIYVMNADGSDKRKLTDNNFKDERPVVSNNGMKIAFYRESNSTAGIYAMDADGSNIQKVVEEADFSSFFKGSWSWSPNDSTLVFNEVPNGKKNDEIYTINIDGTKRKQLTNNSIDDQHPHWSPDGDKIVFQSGWSFTKRKTKSAGGFNLKTMNSDGTDIDQITATSGNDSGSKWSPDGSKIIFTYMVTGGTYDREIYTVMPNGSSRTQITKAKSSNIDNYSPAWSPDGTMFIFYQYDKNTQKGAIMKMNADGSGSAEKLVTVASGTEPDWSPIK